MSCGGGHLGFPIDIKNTSETTNIIKAKLYMNVHWMVLYKLSVFCSDMKFKTFMYSLALIIFVVSEKKAFEHFPIGANVNICPAVAAILPGMIIGRFSTNCLFFMPIENPRWPPLQVID
jgi:hypothetical protein